VQHPHFKVFTHMESIWTIDFRFGVNKMETSYIPSNQVQAFIDKEEQHSDTNCKFTCWQFQRNEIRKLLYPHWDIYLELSRFWTLNINRHYLFCSHLFLESPTFLQNIRFRHSLSFFELLICKFNCSFGPKDRTNNLLLLTKDMVFKRSLLIKDVK